MPAYFRPVQMGTYDTKRQVFAGIERLMRWMPFAQLDLDGSPNKSAFALRPGLLSNSASQDIP
jgi:hypothetical protein